ncbi:MAG: AmmeMemoRadiSam system protein B [Proteobacteria bacterium]|nr:AmmeMemoRadiSam system protein B [Pseudomonadota bacterium]MBU1389275.1 AmmeMemoRadiSam system protein B [Pseudomonadota bacterium]MBU1544095.1 AmmeMemoRadiSam system protein B [Pseudomonadota bacterium]MBU2430095.1 AmmeMemoRadiSam system protein B [Pseudomonadota bacterium]MBU2480630.1 AmmeMemoRadiSam system protein B [Pseudomonadota bacterium]
MEKLKMAFAGAWYPATARECQSSIHQFLKEKQGVLTGDVVGGIVPHAGWYYSGSIACRVIASLQSGHKGPEYKPEHKIDAQKDDPRTIDTIVLFGGHMHPQSDPFVLSHGRIETPFGQIEVDAAFVDQFAGRIGLDKKTPARFPDENTFELQNPFIKYFFPESKIVVCAVSPNATAIAIGKAVADTACEMGKNIRIIGSTDMTHYGPNFGLICAGKGKEAVKWVEKQNDRQAIDAMLKMDETQIIELGLANKSMCCPGAAAATVCACKKMGAASALELDYATSFEKSESDSFVGYSGIVYACS